MKKPSITLKHLISIVNYIGIWFISWSISHWFFSGTRSIIMALLWIGLFVFWQFLEKTYIDHEDTSSFKIYVRIAITGLIFSVGVGMISGWFQHFLDSPLRSLWIIPVWYIISLLIYPSKEELKETNWKYLISTGLIVWVALYGAIYSLIHILPESTFWGDHHKGAETAHTE